ncbi:sugar transferase [Nocardioides sp. SR21]|uniref:sugar transferase n=1 Tax=Nocardioides sp. SR21 TaxID=2919501 RepID=UPI001FAA2C08|nr:sugar transferase [Nocardioides sp. SR21]
MTAILPVAGVPLSAGSRTAEPELGGRPRGGRHHRGYPLFLTLSADIAIAALVALSLASAGTSPDDVAFLLVLGWPLLLLLDGAYGEPSTPSSRRRRLGVLRAGAVLGLACWALPTVVDVATRPAALVLAVATLAATSYGARIITDAWGSHSVRSHGGTRVLVAGEATDVARAVAELRRGPRPAWQVVCACVAGGADCDADVPISAGLDDLVGQAEAFGAEAVLVLPCRELEPLALRRLAWRLEATGTGLYVGTALHDVDPARATLLTAGDLDLLAVRSAPSASAARVIKELMERTAAGVMLLLLLPVLLGVAIAVRRDSPGPAIFRQRRIGRDGRDFTMYKFRTMRTDADARLAELAELNESEGGVLFKVRQDPRITRLGGMLRKYSVDEVPQLVNVLLGDMALVGPRPALADEVARYEHDPRRRLAVKPGLTGLWQVSGRSDLSWEDTVRLDVHYVDNWSLGLDLRILCRTVGTVIRHEGAY